MILSQKYYNMIKNDLSYCYIMEDLFVPIEFSIDINLPPHAIHKDMYKELEKRVVRELSGKCKPKIGYIKPGSVNIIKKQLGQIKGSHFTGNVSFRIGVKCLATQPIKGQKIPCAVISKNDAGILAKNFSIPYYMLFIPKVANDPKSDDIDRVRLNSNIEVTVQTSTIKAASRMRPQSEYWVICDLTRTDVSDIQHQEFFKINDRPVIHIGEKVLAEDIDRDMLTEGMYTVLEDTKTKIDSVHTKYLDLLKSISKADPDHTIDPIVNTKLAVHGDYRRQVKDFVVCYVLSRSSEDMIEVMPLNTNKSGVEINKATDVLTDEVQNLPPIAVDDVLILLYNKTGTVYKIEKVNFWDDHVKYVINPYEMIHIPSFYKAQLKFIDYELKKIDDQSKVKWYDRQNVLNKAAPKPVSRAFYKMQEMYREFPTLLPNNDNARILCIAESPGGFAQSLLHSRSLDRKDTITVVSIKPDEIGGTWAGVGHQQKLYEKLVEMIKKHMNLTVNYIDKYNKRVVMGNEDGDNTVVNLIGGIDNDDGKGDILKLENVDSIVGTSEVQSDLHPNINFFEEQNKAHLITADGGFPHERGTKTEEMLSSKLILSEIIMALRAQIQGGNFILKIYDMATEFTAGLLEILSFCYDRLSIFKPLTSRNASSEKYIICQVFNVNEDDRLYIISELTTVFRSMNDDSFMRGIVTNINQDMTAAILHYNKKFMGKQIDFIDEGSRYTQSYCSGIKDGDTLSVLRTIASKAGDEGIGQYMNAKSFYEM